MSSKMTAGEFSKIISELMKISEYRDFSNNGLQVGNSEATVKKVAFAVDACLETIRKAAEEKADILFVHHGLYWGSAVPVTGIHYDRIKTLLDGNVALFACHLPLDAHDELGNNAQMAQTLGLKDIKPFCSYEGNNIGYYGTLDKALSNSEIIKKLGVRTDRSTVTLDFGKEENRTVGIVSGGGANEVSEAISLGLDCYITGEKLHQTYHQCKEEGINMLCLGHYETETFGVKAVMKWVEENLGLETCFIDVPTHL